MNKAVKDLSIKILQLGEGRDAETVITAIGMAAASAVIYGVSDPNNRALIQLFFIRKFIEACDDLVKPKGEQE